MVRWDISQKTGCINGTLVQKGVLAASFPLHQHPRRSGCKYMVWIRVENVLDNRRMLMEIITPKKKKKTYHKVQLPSLSNRRLIRSIYITLTQHIITKCFIWAASFSLVHRLWLWLKQTKGPRSDGASGLWRNWAVERIPTWQCMQSKLQLGKVIILWGDAGLRPFWKLWMTSITSLSLREAVKERKSAHCDNLPC